MRPSLFTPSTCVSPRRHSVRSAGCLDFRQMTVADLPEILPFLQKAPWRTCDFTAGGMLMWVDYFRYSFCIVDGTLFVKGLAEDDVSLPAFSMPIGQMPVDRAVALIREYCRANAVEPRLSAVPEEALPLLMPLNPKSVTELTDWADYLYDAVSLATLSGKKLNKKRNHVNRFMADNPGYSFDPLDHTNIGAVRAFHDGLVLPADKPVMAEYERMQVTRVLDAPEAYPFEGAVLSVPGRGVVAFTLGEVIGDTLHVHIEKMDHEVAGAGETINRLFAEMMLGRHPEIAYINRQDDAGDPGLRRAKESYHPLRLLRKFNVVL